MTRASETLFFVAVDLKTFFLQKKTELNNIPRYLKRSSDKYYAENRPQTYISGQTENQNF